MTVNLLEHYYNNNNNNNNKCYYGYVINAVYDGFVWRGLRIRHVNLK